MNYFAHEAVKIGMNSCILIDEDFIYIKNVGYCCEPAKKKQYFLFYDKSIIQSLNLGEDYSSLNLLFLYLSKNQSTKIYLSRYR